MSYLSYGDPLKGIVWFFIITVAIFAPLFYSAYQSDTAKELEKSRVSIQVTINGTKYIDINIGGKK